jgi:hypothetical protein
VPLPVDSMARAAALAARVALALLLAHSAAAAVVQQDNSAVCQSVMPACEAKCQGGQYFFICAAGNGPMGTPYIICRCAQPAPPIGGAQQSERPAAPRAPARACAEAGRGPGGAWPGRRAPVAARGARPVRWLAAGAVALAGRCRAARRASGTLQQPGAAVSGNTRRGLVKGSVVASAAGPGGHAEKQNHVPACSAGGSGPLFLFHPTNAAHSPGRAARAVARLILSDWPGANACNQKTWANDCTSQMTITVNGANVTLTPSVSNAFNEQCAAQPGLVIGPKGTQAAVVFPQYPIGLTSTNPDGSITVDFSQTAADDPNQNDWSKCILTYKVVQGTFLDPRIALAAQQQQALAQQAALQQQAAGAQASAIKAAESGAAGMALRAQVAAVAGVAAAYFAFL